MWLLYLKWRVIFAAQELRVLQKLQPTEDALDLRLNAKLNDEADILVRASSQDT